MSFQPYPPNYPFPLQQKSDDLDLPTLVVTGILAGKIQPIRKPTANQKNPLKKKAGYFMGEKPWHFLGNMVPFPGKIQRPIRRRQARPTPKARELRSEAEVIAPRPPEVPIW